MSISSEINRISGNISDSLSAVAAKGVTVPSGSNSDDLAGLIAQIPGNYSVTLSLTGASSSAAGTKVVSGGSYFTEITPTTTGHKINSITVTMGGVDITSQVFKPGVGAKAITANGTYSASSDNLSGYDTVTVNVSGGGGGSGNVEIEIVSENLHDSSEDVANTYINGASESSYNGWSSTGYIPVKSDTYYCVKNTPGNKYNAFYKSDKTSAKASVVVPESSTADDYILIKTTSNTAYIRMSGASSGVANYEIYEVNVVEAGSGGGASEPNLQAKTNISPTTSSQTITADSGYDGLSSVQINAMPTGTAGTPSATKGTVSNHQVSVTPSVTNATGYITGGTKTGTTVTVSASELVSGSETKTANGTYDVTNLAELVVNVSSSGSSKNVQIAQSTSRASSSTYTSLVSLTCNKAGKYDIYWDCFRSSTGGTSGSQLYVGGSAYGTANTTFTNHAQTNHLTNVSLTANQTVAVYARSRGSNYYAYVGQLTIIEQ